MREDNDRGKHKPFRFVMSFSVTAERLLEGQHFTFEYFILSESKEGNLFMRNKSDLWHVNLRILFCLNA